MLVHTRIGFLIINRQIAPVCFTKIYMKKTIYIATLALFLGIAAFIGGGHTAYASGQCNINSFYPSSNNVSYGGYATLIINSTGCQNLTLSGGSYSNVQMGNSNSFSVGPLYSSTTFYVTGYDYYNVQTNASTFVTVNNGNNGNNYYPNQINQVNGAVTTYAVTNISNANATFNGYVGLNNNQGCIYTYFSNYGCNNFSSYYFQYGTSQNSLVTQTPTQTLNNMSGSVMANVSNLLPNTTYYVQLVSTSNYGGINNGGIVQFTTGSYGAIGTVVSTTANATNITATGARLNGVVYTTESGIPLSEYFEYGTSQNCFGQNGATSLCTQQTTIRPITTYTSTNYSEDITVSPSTTYYYRQVAVAAGQYSYGSIVSFTTPAAVVTPPTPIVITRVIDNTQTNAAVSLSITGSPQSVNSGGSISYFVTYQNNSKQTLSNAVLNVLLPSGVTFQQASQGMLTTNNTILATIGSLAPNQTGAVTISATASSTDNSNNNLSATATLSYTNSNNAQSSVVAYALNNVFPAPQVQNNTNVNQNNTQNNNSNLAGLAIDGGGFFPTTLAGWVLIIAVILVLIYISRELFNKSKNAQNNTVSASDHHNDIH